MINAVNFPSICVTVLAFGVVSGNAEPPAIITEADAGHLIALRIGRELVLNLESNPSTGYRWVQADTETPVLIVFGKPAYKQGSPLPGAGGVESWTFRAVERGAQTLKFEYRRPWEKNTPPANTIVLHVTVR
jgi:inhibitor of cysteine peptidase